MRRIGVLTPFAADDPEGHGRLTAFAQGLQQLGWTVGRNISIDYRWGDGNLGPKSRLTSGKQRRGETRRASAGTTDTVEEMRADAECNA
jgi:hypothetical protein